MKKNKNKIDTSHFKMGAMEDPLKPVKDFYNAACGERPVIQLGDEKFYVCNNLRNLWEPRDRFSFWKSYGLLFVIVPPILWDLLVDPFTWLIGSIPIIGPIIASLWFVIIIDLLSFVGFLYWQGPIALLGLPEFFALFELIPIIGPFLALVALFPWWGVANLVWFFFFRKTE